MKKLRVLALMDKSFVPPDTLDDVEDENKCPWLTEFDIINASRALGHEVHVVGVASDLGELHAAIHDFKPHVVFNILEEFHGVGEYVAHVLGYLELLKQHYTGCNPEGVMLSWGKSLSKAILRHHNIPIPEFTIIPLGRAVRVPAGMSFPMIVKSSTEHGSVGIAQASVVHDEEKLAERVQFVFDQLGTDAIVEEYIDGRELYVGIMGNTRLDVFPIWELHFDKLPAGVPRIATEKIKWDVDYQERAGIRTNKARNIPPELYDRIVKLCKRAYKALRQTGYARIDLRLAKDGRVYVLECNPNPQLSWHEDFARAGKAFGLDYESLIQRILNLGMRHQAGWKQ